MHRRSDHVYRDPESRAEKLLREFLTPEQLEDWVQTGGFNVRGANQRLYRIVSRSRTYQLSQVVNDAGHATNVWCQEVAQIPADNALGLMLYLQNDPALVARSGCMDMTLVRPGDYGGKL